MSKTQEAVKLVQGGMTAYAAAKQVGISISAVTRGVQRAAKYPDKRCPCCNQIVMDEELLKKIKAE